MFRIHKVDEEQRWRFEAQVGVKSLYSEGIVTVGEAQLSSSGGIWNVEIYPDHKRQGYGTKLMIKIIETAKGYGIKRLWLYVKTDNTAAIALYSKLGFKITKLIENRNDVLMEKTLV